MGESRSAHPRLVALPRFCCPCDGLAANMVCVSGLVTNGCAGRSQTRCNCSSMRRARRTIAAGQNSVDSPSDWLFVAGLAVMAFQDHTDLRDTGDKSKCVA